MDIEELQQLKALLKRGDDECQKTNSKKRDLIELEHQELESKKKAKTSVGREPAEIWYVYLYDYKYDYPHFIA